MYKAPRLYGVSTSHFIEFNSLTKIYEKQIADNGRKRTKKLICTSHRERELQVIIFYAYIEDDDLKFFIAVELVKESLIDELTKRQIKSCIAERYKEVIGKQLYLDDQMVEAKGMKMNIEDEENRVWPFRRRYSNTLNVVGCVNITQERPGIALNNVLTNLKRVQWY